MKVTSAIFSSFSGSIAGAVAAKARGGIAYLRARVIPSNPSTSFQSAIRSAVSAVAARWSSILTQANRDSWNGKAVGKQTGQTLHARTNNPRLYANGTDRRVTPAGVAETAQINPVNTAPANVTASFTPPTITIDATANELGIAWNVNDPWYTEVVAAGKNAIAMIYITPQQSPSREARQYPYQLAACLVRKNGGTAMAATLSVDLEALGITADEDMVSYVKIGIQQSDGSVSLHSIDRVAHTA
jgi:hypothetical protein